MSAVPPHRCVCEPQKRLARLEVSQSHPSTGSPNTHTHNPSTSPHQRKPAPPPATQRCCASLAAGAACSGPAPPRLNQHAPCADQAAVAGRRGPVGEASHLSRARHDEHAGAQGVAVLLAAAGNTAWIAAWRVGHPLPAYSSVARFKLTRPYPQYVECSLQRLMRDFKRLRQDPPQGVNGSPNPDNIMTWNAVIFGPDDTPWDGGGCLRGWWQVLGAVRCCRCVGGARARAPGGTATRNSRCCCCSSACACYQVLSAVAPAVVEVQRACLA